jgi:hypothetical protein
MKIKRELGMGICFLALSGLYLAGTFSISTFNPFGNRGLTSRSVPQVLAFFAILLSLIQIISALVKGKKDEAGDSPPEAEAGEKTAVFKISKSAGQMLLSLFIICAYIFFFQRLGFILSSVLFLLAETFLLTSREKRKKWALFIVCLSTGLPVLIYFLFTKSLSLFLPRGLLG